ncbi:MAG: TIGR04282 family arsenosugar biosynthesis glycosyltransferase [Campylobacterales bacterium]
MIVLLMKAPQIGRVKTRLAASIGNEAALQIYARCVARMFAALKASGRPWRVAYDPPGSAAMIAAEFGPFEGFAQTSGDLGARMKHAFESAFKKADRVVLIGSDAPQIDAALLNTALEELHEHDCVIGPAGDGGYYLIGFTRSGFAPEAFDNMVWSVPDVFGQTQKRLSRQRVAVLPTLSDLDTIDDYQRLKEYL